MQNTGVFLSKNLESNSMTAAASKTLTLIWVTFKLPGIHCYPNAPEDVAYLRSPHRHMFGFKVSIEVFHGDRELEFHQFKNWLVSLYQQGTLELNHKSCEMISDELAEHIVGKYPDRKIVITVDEDEECGSSSFYG